MNHFYQNIQGWSDGIPQFYDQIINWAKTEKRDFYHFVEVGTWRGKSAAYMTVEIINSGLNIQFDCVDTWKGSQNEMVHLNDPAVIHNTLYEEFIENMKPVEGHFRPVRMTSLEAAECYDDKSLDFVFIDAQHDYESVKSDILAWRPKVRIGGILSGHDYGHEIDNEVGRAVRECIAAQRLILPGWCWATQIVE